MSAFETWFVAQHGERPGGTETDESLHAKQIAGEAAGEVIKRRYEWDARFESALYAWQARERELKDRNDRR